MAEELDAAARTDYEAETTQSAPPPAQEFVEGELLGDEERREPAPVEDASSTFVAESQFADNTLSSERQEVSADMQMAPTERLPDAFRVEETRSEMSDPQSGAAASASPVAGQIRLEQLSPEVIDAIARRAVELLSARVVEQVAWEVVPDLAELLIKRRLEEKSGQ
jgi:hypothetical protein